MTATSSPPPETPEPVASERPRLLINGEPVRPEELCRGLSESVLQMLSAPKQKEPESLPEPLPPVPAPKRKKKKPFPFWLLWVGVLGVGLVVALRLLLS